MTSPLAAKPYGYLLGLYLGDGCISRIRNVWRLRIILDAKYPGIMPGQLAAVLQRPINCVEVYLCSKHWPCLFPQHGPGKKHTRQIRPEPWRELLVKEATEDFIRGLIHSDGCRVVANDRGVRSVRYHFSNRSDDIKGLFTWALDDLGIPWTRLSERDIAVYRKAATASTNSSGRSAERYRRGVSTTRRRRPALIVLVIVAAVACLALGWWQLERYESASGSGQNLGYALQWPLFAAFVVYAYRKFVRYEEEPPQLQKPDAVTEIPADLLPERPKPTHEAPDDPTLAEYNAYLAELAEADKENRTNP